MFQTTIQAQINYFLETHTKLRNKKKPTNQSANQPKPQHQKKNPKPTNKQASKSPNKTNKKNKHHHQFLKTKKNPTNISLESVQAFYLPKLELMLKGKGSSFGTSAETRGTVFQPMVKEEECSNLSLLSGVGKHTEEVMKNSPKQKESDLVSLP